MSYVVLPKDLHRIFQAIYDRLDRLERTGVSPFPPVTADPTGTKPGDAWLNTTTNQAKIVDAAGTVRVVTWV